MDIYVCSFLRQTSLQYALFKGGEDEEEACIVRLSREL